MVKDGMQARTEPAEVLRGNPLPWLAACALAYVLLHHVGVGLKGLGGPDGSAGTRWADWVDLLTPYAFLLSAGAALRAGGAGRGTWTIYVVGVITYVEGHGIHLAANSVGNVAPGEVAHLWDEVVGHYFWYAGVALVFAALAGTLARREPPRGPLPYILAVLVGLTSMTNALEGGTALAQLAIAVGFSIWGLRTRDGLGRLLPVAFVPTVVLLVGYGVWQGGFPQPTELGWI